MPLKPSSGASEPSLILYQLVCIQTYTVYIIIVVILTIMIYYYYDLLLLWFIIIMIIILVNTSSTWVMLQLPIHHEPYLTSQLISIMVDIHMFPGGVNQPEQKPRCLSQITFIHRLFWMNPIKNMALSETRRITPEFQWLKTECLQFFDGFPIIFPNWNCQDLWEQTPFSGTQGYPRHRHLWIQTRPARRAVTTGI